MYKKVLILIVILLLGIGNVYFYNEAKKLDYAINIGIPVQDADETTGIDFYEPLSDKEEANLLIFSFMRGVSIEKPAICEVLPNLTVWFSDWKEGMTYSQVNMWLDKETVIIETDVNATQPQYKLIDGERAVDLKKLIEKYDIEKMYK